MSVSNDNLLSRVFIKRMEFDPAGYLVAVEFNDASGFDAAMFILWFRDYAQNQYKETVKTQPPPPPEAPAGAFKPHDQP